MDKIKAYSLLILAQIALGINIIIGKYLLGLHFSIYVFLTLRFLVSSIFLTFFMLLSKSFFAMHTHPHGKMQSKDWQFLVAQAFTGGFLFNILFFSGVKYTTVISAGVISSTLPLIIALCAFFCLNEKITFFKWSAIGFAMLGIIIISLDNVQDKIPIHSLWGNTLVLLAMFPEALYSIFNKYMSLRITPLGGATILNWVVFVLFLPVVFFSESMKYFPIGIVEISLILLSGLCGMLFFWGWAKGLMVIEAGVAGIFGGILPIVTAILGWGFLNEPFNRYDFLGMGLVFVSLGMVFLSSK